MRDAGNVTRGGGKVLGEAESRADVVGNVRGKGTRQVSKLEGGGTTRMHLVSKGYTPRSESKKG